MEWLALVIGNSRLHWAWFQQAMFVRAWDTPHFTGEAITTLLNDLAAFNDFLSPANIPPVQVFPPLLMASVVPEQTQQWQAYPHHTVLTLADIPIQQTYSTFGIDRALALWGALQIHAPALVIDAGTALTLTGANRDRKLVGGAILPGLYLQLNALATRTAALPLIPVQHIHALPPRWVRNTPDAILSGVLYSLLAGLREWVHVWLAEFPDSAIVLTGGDGQLLHGLLQQQNPELASRIQVDPHLLFRGLPNLWRGGDGG